jgi:hypothetical protein
MKTSVCSSVRIDVRFDHNICIEIAYLTSFLAQVNTSLRILPSLSFLYAYL